MINYLLNATMFNCIHGVAPQYLCNSIVMACEANDRTTRINDTLQVDVPICYTNSHFLCITTIADDTFSISGAYMHMQLGK